MNLRVLQNAEISWLVEEVLVSQEGQWSTRTVFPKESTPQGQCPKDCAPQGQCSPRAVVHKGSAPQGQYSPRTAVHKCSAPQGQCSTRTVVHKDSAPQGQWSTRTVVPKDSDPHGQCSTRTVLHKDSAPHGQYSTRTVFYKDSALHGQCSTRIVLNTVIEISAVLPSIRKSRFLRSCVSIPLMFLASTISPCHSFFHRPILFPAGFNHLFILPAHFLPSVLNNHTNSNLFYPLSPHPFVLLHILTILEDCTIISNNRFRSYALQNKMFLCQQ